MEPVTEPARGGEHLTKGRNAPAVSSSSSEVILPLPRWQFMALAQVPGAATLSLERREIFQTGGGLSDWKHTYMTIGI